MSKSKNKQQVSKNVSSNFYLLPRSEPPDHLLLLASSFSDYLRKSACFADYFCLPPSRQEQRNEYRNFRVVFFYCILIILLPVSTFFATKYVLFDGYFQLSSVSSNIYAAVAAVIALHIALGLYIYRAYFDSGPSDQSTKLAQKQD